MNFVDLREIDLCDDIPDAVRSHPGMISARERILLYSLAANHFSGNGCIIDAGTFLGASTMAFGCGLPVRTPGAGSSRISTPIESFERGIVSRNFERHASKAGLPILPVGESFEGILRQLIEPVRNEVNLHIGDILEFDGKTLGDIEICFLDILKNEKLTLHCMKIFFPRLLPGAYVIQQDYFFDGLPFIKYLMEALSDHFEYLGEVQSSAVFRLRKVIDANDLSDHSEQLDGNAKLELHRRAELRTRDPSRRYLMQISRVRLLAVLGDLPAAESLWRHADEKYASLIKTDDGEYKPHIVWRIATLNALLERRRSRRGTHRPQAQGGPQGIASSSE